MYTVQPQLSELRLSEHFALALAQMHKLIYLSNLDDPDGQLSIHQSVSLTWHILVPFEFIVHYLLLHKPAT